MAATSHSPGNTPLGPTLAALTLARLVLNGVRRFPYVILTPMAAALGVDRAVVETALSLQWGTGILSPLAGPYIDRLGRKRTMLAGIGSLTLFASLAALGPGAGVILAVIAAIGLSKMLYDPSLQAYIGDRTPYARRGTAIGITELSWSLALFVFGPLAAWLIARVSLTAIFAVVAAGGAVSFVLLLALVPGDAPTGGNVQPVGTLRAGLQALRASRPALAVLGVALLISIAAESMAIVYQEWLADTFGLSVEAIGQLSWVIVAAEVLGELFVIAAADRLGKRRLVLIALVAAGFAYLAFSLSAGSLVAALAALFLMYLTFETSVVALIPLVTEVMPQARGTMMSGNVAAMAAGRAAGTLLGGRMFRLAGYALNGSVALVLNLVAVVLLWRSVSERGGRS